MQKQAAFFFGSGISYPSDMPSVSQISRSALDEDWWFDYSNPKFFPGRNPSGAADETTEAVKGFLRVINAISADYLSDLSRSRATRKPHYEDWFSLAAQAAEPEVNHVPNLAVVECLRRLRRETASFHCGFKSGTTGAHGFVGLAHTACDYLHWVVHVSLGNPKIKRRGLDRIGEIAGKVDALDIFSLNHDLLMEEQFDTDNIGFEDGFGDLGHGEFKVYNGWSSAPRKKARLFKLHGSLNWYFYEFPNKFRQYAIPRGLDQAHSKDEKGNFVMPLDNKAAFLSGTIVKEQNYGVGFWGNMFRHFHDHLSRHTHLLCCGYGFGDPGINARLAQWMQDRLDGSNRLVVMTPEAPQVFLSDKPLWLHKLASENRVEFLGHYLEDCPVDELEPYFDPLT
jgi:hypothetical protein